MSPFSLLDDIFRHLASTIIPSRVSVVMANASLSLPHLLRGSMAEN